MRWFLSALGLLVLVLVTAPREAGACLALNFEEHALDATHLADAVQPGPVEVAMVVESDDGGCGGSPRSRCGQTSSRRLVLHVVASDDRTPPDKLGYRIGVASGTAPFDLATDVRPVEDRVVLPIADDASLDFELQVRAVDLNGNIGPATIMSVANEASGGCAVHHAGGLISFVLVGLAFGFVVARRRR